VIGSVVGVAVGLAASPLVGAAADRLRRRPQISVPVTRRVRAVLVAGLAGFGGGVVPQLADGWLGVFFVLFVVLAVIAAAVDLAELRLPDVLVYPMLLGGVVVSIVGGVTGAVGHPWRALVGAVVYGGWMLLVAVIVPDGYGLGDVKLAAGIGLWMGLLSWLAISSAILFGQLLIVASLVVVRVGRLRRSGVGGHAPLGPALVAGAFLAMLAG
jgi:leader peptidase (prepilin peptidase)/N-methyltransferase